MGSDSVGEHYEDKEHQPVWLSQTRGEDGQREGERKRERVLFSPVCANRFRFYGEGWNENFMDLGGLAEK